MRAYGPRPDLAERNYKHGMTGTAEYKIWASMISRCYRRRDTSYRRYGAHGISVCNRWRESFQAFYSDVGPRPSPPHSIDRIDPNGNYEPSNVRWATVLEQKRNRRDAMWIEAFGSRRHVTEWAEITGIYVNTIRYRIKHGWTPEKALSVGAPTQNQD